MSYTKAQIKNAIDYVTSQMECPADKVKWVESQLFNILKKITDGRPEQFHLKLQNEAFKEFFESLENKKLSFPKTLNILMTRNGANFDVSDGKRRIIFQSPQKSPLVGFVDELKAALEEYEEEKADKQREKINRERRALRAVSDTPDDVYEADSDEDFTSDDEDEQAENNSAENSFYFGPNWDVDQYFTQMQDLTFLFDGRDALEPEEETPSVTTNNRKTTTRIPKV